MNRPSFLVAAFFSLMTFLCVTGPARAVVFTVEFEGVVTSVESLLSFGPVAVGDPVQVTFTLDSAASDTNPDPGEGSPERGEYA